MELFNKLQSKMKELGIEKDKINEIVEFSKKNVPLEFRTKDDYKQLKGEFEAFKENQKEKDSLINSLKEKAETVEESEQRVNELIGKLEEKDLEHQKYIQNMKFESMIKRKIDSDKDINPKARDTFYKLLNTDEIKLDGDDLLGYDAQANKLKEVHDYVLVKDKFKGNDPNPTNKVDDTPKDNPFKRGDSYNLTKQGQLVKNSPEEAKKLIIAAGMDPIKFGIN